SGRKPRRREQKRSNVDKCETRRYPRRVSMTVSNKYPLIRSLYERNLIIAPYRPQSRPTVPILYCRQFNKAQAGCRVHHQTRPPEFPRSCSSGHPEALRFGMNTPAEARVTTPYEELLAGLIERLKDYMYLPDPGPFVLVLGAVAANRLEGDPVWLMLVASA